MKVLLAVDQSRNSLAAARWVQALSLPAGSVLYLMHVFELKQWPEWPLFGNAQEFQEKLLPLRAKATVKAQRFITRMAESFHGQRSLKVQPNVIEGIPGAEILRTVEEYPMDLVVVGTKGLSGMKRFLLGSVSEWVLNESPCSVLVVRGQPRWTSRKTRGMRVLFATDGSHDAKMAIMLLKRLNLPKSAHVTIFHAAETSASLTTMATLTAHVDVVQLAEAIKRRGEQAGERLLQEARRELGRRTFCVESKMTKGHAAEEILKAAKRFRSDLVVVGSKGLTGLRRFLLGSVAHKVACHAPCSVMVVRQPLARGKSQKSK